jgi:hypothetical protein
LELEFLSSSEEIEEGWWGEAWLYNDPERSEE